MADRKHTARVGQTITVERIGRCIVRVIRPAGTIDVERVECGNWFRVSGLAGAR